MRGSLFLLSLFPVNGVDRSLHVAVFIGLVLTTFFAEALGWTYAGLVVPGYLATLCAAAPVTAACVAAESVLTYLLVATVGRWIPFTGAWSTAFGRERFYLFIVAAVLVRLGMEGTLLPALAARWHFTHAADLYSIGLVIVPLVANAFWNAGLHRALPRIGVVVFLTWACLVLLFHTTNLSTSRFLVINDHLSLKFFEQPKAQILLVLGALLGARNNVKYGWDYNGILVPGLLAVAWYEPSKLLFTVLEALVIYGLASSLCAVRPLSRLLIVGTRRMLLAYTVGMLLMMVVGHAVARLRPGTPVIDYFGFGYLLPSLIAVKMWNKGDIGVVLMPTLQVSLVAFVCANVVGLGLNALAERAAAAQEPEPAPLEPVPEVGFALVLADSAPASDDRTALAGAAHRAALGVAQEVLAAGEPSAVARARASHAAVRVGVQDDPRGGAAPWFVVAPRTGDPDAPVVAPRAMFRRRGASGPRLLLLVRGARVGSPLPVLAEPLADAVGADAVVMLSRHPELARLDERFALEIARAGALDDALVLDEDDGDDAPVLALARPPRGLDVVEVGRRLGSVVAVRWGTPAGDGALLGDAPRLTVPASLAERLAARSLGAPSIEAWDGRLQAELARRAVALTSVGTRGFVAPTIEELRLFDEAIYPPLLRWTGRGGPPGEPAAWWRAVAARLGYRFVRVGAKGREPEALGVAETEAPRRGNPTLLLRPQLGEGDALLVEIPAPRWELGTLGAGTSFAHALDAGGLVIAGALPGADPRGAADPRREAGLRSFYQRIHERWLGGEGPAVSVQGIAPGRGDAADGVLTFGFELLEHRPAPGWAEPLYQLLTVELGLDVSRYDGSADRAPFSGASDPTMAYARRFHEGRYAVVYLAGAARQSFVDHGARRRRRAARRGAGLPRRGPGRRRPRRRAGRARAPPRGRAVRQGRAHPRARPLRRSRQPLRPARGAGGVPRVPRGARSRRCERPRVGPRRRRGRGLSPRPRRPARGPPCAPPGDPRRGAPRGRGGRRPRRGGEGAVTRVALALAVLVLTGLLVLRLAVPGLAGASAPSPPRDEALVYEIPAESPLEIRVTGDLDTLVMTTWAVLGDDARCDPEARYAYSVTTSLVDEHGAEAGAGRFDLETRRSCDAGDGAELAAELAGGGAAVADPRTTILPLSALLERGGILRLRAAAGGAQRVLARIHGRVRRSPSGSRVRDLTLTPEARHALVEHRASLGFDELPASARANATTESLRRLDALGREGEGFRLERLIFSDFRAPLPGAAPPLLGFPIGAGHAAAYNVGASVSLRLEGPPRRTVRALEGAGPGAPVLLGEDGTATIDVPATGPRTLVLAADGEDFPVRASVAMERATAQIGDVTVRARPDGRAEIAPDVRHVKYTRLHPTLPIVTRVAKGQELLGVVLRAQLGAGDARDEAEIAVRARFGPGPRDEAHLAVTRRRSRFERWSDGAGATDAYRAILRVPLGAASVELSGEQGSAVALETLDPGSKDVLRLPYQVALAEREVWRYAPFDTRAWAPIRPDDHEELEREGRLCELREQVRIESTGAAGGGPPRPERLLDPEGAPVSRRFFEEATLPRGAAFPARAFTPLPARRLLVPGAGPRTGRVGILYRVPPDRLGGTATVRVDGEIAAQPRLLLGAGTIEIEALPGPRAITVEWPPARGAPSGASPCAYADVAPEGGGAIVRERRVFELRPGAPLTLRVPQREGELDQIDLFVVDEGRRAPWSLRYQLEMGAPPSRGRFFRRLTTLAAIVSGQASGLPRGRLWEGPLDAGGEPPDSVARAAIPLGDDYPAGERRLRLEVLSAASPLWVRAVLVGQAPGASEGESDVWVEEVP